MPENLWPGVRASSEYPIKIKAELLSPAEKFDFEVLVVYDAVIGWEDPFLQECPSSSGTEVLRHYKPKKVKGEGFFWRRLFVIQRREAQLRLPQAESRHYRFQRIEGKSLGHMVETDMKAMAKDVAPFLFKAEDAKKVELFEKYLNQVEL